MISEVEVKKVECANIMAVQGTRVFCKFRQEWVEASQCTCSPQMKLEEADLEW